MRILICEEDEKYIEELIESIESFPCAEDLVFESYTETPFVVKRLDVQSFDMAFIGPVVNGKSGVTLGQMLKKAQPHCILFLVCEDYKYMHEGFRCHAFQLLLKSQPKLLETEFQRAMGLFYKINFEMGFKLNSGKEVQLLPSEIEYIETTDEGTIVVTKTERLYGKFKNLKTLKAKLLDYHFFQMHPRFFVNMEHIKMLKAGELGLDNGDCIPTSILNKEIIDRAIQSFMNL